MEFSNIFENIETSRKLPGLFTNSTIIKILSGYQKANLSGHTISPINIHLSLLQNNVITTKKVNSNCSILSQTYSYLKFHNYLLSQLLLQKPHLSASGPAGSIPGGIKDVT